MIIQVKYYTLLNGWIDFINKNLLRNQKDRPEELIVDFSLMYFIKPFQIVMLSCLIEEYYLAGTKITFIEGNTSVKKYLTDVRFFEYWNGNFNRSKYTKQNKGTSLFLWKIGKSQIDLYTDYAKRYFQDGYFNNKDLQPLHTILSELYNNIFDHSGSTVDGYSYVQYYPNIDSIEISICDFGIGIAKTINDYRVRNGESAVDEVEALKLAFQKRYSAKSMPHNMGLGLHTLSTCISSVKGSVELYSYNSYITKYR